MSSRGKEEGKGVGDMCFWSWKLSTVQSEKLRHIAGSMEDSSPTKKGMKGKRRDFTNTPPQTRYKSLFLATTTTTTTGMFIHFTIHMFFFLMLK